MNDAESDPQASIVAAAAAEQRAAAVTAVEAADRADSYAAMLRLAGLLDDSGDDLRRRAALGALITRDSSFVDSAALAPRTHQEAEEAIQAATTGKHGLLARSIELDADALVLRATVLTYQWIDELQDAAFQTLGTIAGRAIGYLAPEVALGGAIVSAGLIETDALDRDGVAAYLSELAESNPELMDHVTTGGGLLDSLQMRSMLTAGVLAGDPMRLSVAGGLRAIGVDPLPTGAHAAVRDVGAGVVSHLLESLPPNESDQGEGAPPRDLASLMAELAATAEPVVVRRVGAGRYVVYLNGPAANGETLRLVTGDGSSYAGYVVRCIEKVVAGEDDVRVMLVGTGQGGVGAAEVAAGAPSRHFVIEQVVTAGSPCAHVPRIPESTRVLSLEDRADPVALLGSLMNIGATNRVTVVHDVDPGSDDSGPVHGGRVSDAATHPALVAELDRLRDLGFLGR